MATPHDANQHVPHALLYRRVIDVKSGTEGILMGVVHENVATEGERWVDIAYIRPVGGGIETSTAASNIVAAP